MARKPGTSRRAAQVLPNAGGRDVDTASDIAQSTESEDAGDTLVGETETEHACPWAINGVCPAVAAGVACADIFDTTILEDGYLVVTNDLRIIEVRN